MIVLYKCINLRKKLIFSLCLIAFVFIVYRILCFNTVNAENDEVFLPVIMYHSVYGYMPQDYVITPEQLENDMKWLADNGYTSVTAQQIIDHTLNNYTLPQKSVLITFDDGFYNNLSVALPVLKKYKMHAVISIVGRFTDEYAENDPHSDSYSYLTWNDISELTDSGYVEFGNHTYDMHSAIGRRKGCSKMENESDDEYKSALTDDILKLQNEFSQHSHDKPLVFAYPFGCVSKESTDILKEIGFKMTFNCREKGNYITRDPDCLFEIFRYNRNGNYSTEEFMTKITQTIDK